MLPLNMGSCQRVLACITLLASEWTISADAATWQIPHVSVRQTRETKQLEENLIVPSISLVLDKGELVSDIDTAPSPYLEPPRRLAPQQFSVFNDTTIDSYLVPPFRDSPQQFRSTEELDGATSVFTPEKNSSNVLKSQNDTDSYLVPPFRDSPQQFRSKEELKTLFTPEKNVTNVVRSENATDLPPAPLTYQVPPKVDAPQLFRVDNTSVTMSVAQPPTHLVPPLDLEPVLFRVSEKNETKTTS